MVDRDLVAEERAARQAAGHGAARRSGMDAGTRRLALIAGGGAISGMPADPGGMQLMAGQVAQTNGPSAQALAPGPEAPAPEALQAEVDAARKADAPPAPAVSPASPPAASSVSAAATHAPVAVAPTTAVSADTGPRPPVAVPPAAVGEDSPDVGRDVAPGIAPTPGTAPAVDAAPDAAPPADAGGHAVQLAALDSEAAAHAEWSRLARRAPSLLGDRAPVIVHIARNGRQFYRLRTGGFASVEDATVFCGRARALGIACTPADF